MLRPSSAASGLLALLLVPLASAGAPPSASPAGPLKVSSNLMVEQDLSVTTRVTGVVDTILADRGNEVKKGQALATLDQRELELDRRAAAETLALAELDYKRYQELYKQRLASESELEQRKSRFELAKVEFERAKLVIDRSVVRAPFDGVVVDRFVRVGQKVLLEESAPLFKVMAFEPLLARAYLPERSLAHVRVGMAVSVSSSEFPAVKTQGQVTFLSPVVDPASGTVQAIVRVQRDAKRALRPGMAVQLEFPSGP